MIALAGIRVVVITKVKAVVRVVVFSFLGEATCRVASTFVFNVVPDLHLKEVRLHAFGLARELDLVLHDLDVDDRAVTDQLVGVPRVTVLVENGNGLGRRAVSFLVLADKLDDRFASEFVRRVVFVGLALLHVEAVNAKLLKGFKAFLVEKNVNRPLKVLTIVRRTRLAQQLAPVSLGLNDLGFQFFFNQLCYLLSLYLYYTRITRRCQQQKHGQHTD
jgi:hypothetical protein